MAQNYGLGRGLSSLIPQKRKPVSSSGSLDEAGKKIDRPEADFNYFGSVSGSGAFKSGQESDDKHGRILEIDVNDIVKNPHQPRLKFDQAKLQELADSIKEHGIIQPIAVTKNEGGYEIIAGERRFQAAKIAGLKKIPAIVKIADDQKKLELAVVENIQRHDLDPIEEARSYKKMAEEFALTQEEIAKKLGKSRSAVANKIRLLELSVEIQKALVEGKITEGHAKLLLAIPNPEKQRAFYELIIKNSLTVRQTEEKTKEIAVRHHKRNLERDPEIKNIENELSQAFGTKVKLSKAGSGGKIVIEYYSKEELENILGKMKQD